MFIETRDIESEDFPGVTFRVVIESEQDHMDSPRDWWPTASDLDVSMWRDDLWEFVWVQVTRLHACQDCRDVHETNDRASLGMVELGRGDGWSVSIDQLIVDHPVPELIEEIVSTRKVDHG